MNESFILNDDFSSFLEKIYTKNQWLKNQFKQVFYLSTTRKFTLIPDEIFVPEKLKSFFELNHQLDDLDEIHFNSLKNIDAKLVFVIPQIVRATMTKFYSNIVFLHQNTCLLKALYKENSVKFGNKVVVNVNKTDLDVFVLNMGKLVLLNNFKFENKNDALYYILNVFDKFKLNPVLTELIYTYSTEENTSLKEELEKYIKKTSQLKLSHQRSFSYLFDKINKQSFLNLINSIECGSLADH